MHENDSNLITIAKEQTYSDNTDHDNDIQSDSNIHLYKRRQTNKQNKAIDDYKKKKRKKHVNWANNTVITRSINHKLIP